MRNMPFIQFLDHWFFKDFWIGSQLVQLIKHLSYLSSFFRQYIVVDYSRCPSDFWKGLFQRPE